MMLQYRLAEEDDISAIYSQAKRLIDQYEDCDSIDYEKVMAWVYRKISSNISQYRCVLADGEICAYFRLCDDGELDDLYVLPPYRSMGIGAEILRKCVDESREKLWLYVFSHNLRAISFYERHGFTIRETVGNTRFIMERKG